MDLQQIINKIINLPCDFRAQNNEKSIYTLLEETSYFENHEQINENLIANELRKNENCTSSWLAWSEDKRGGEGWWFLINDDNKYEIGLITDQDGKNQYLEFFDSINACAAFIKREIEMIRLIR